MDGIVENLVRQSISRDVYDQTAVDQAPTISVTRPNYSPTNTIPDYHSVLTNAFPLYSPAESGKPLTKKQYLANRYLLCCFSQSSEANSYSEKQNRNYQIYFNQKPTDTQHLSLREVNGKKLMRHSNGGFSPPTRFILFFIEKQT